MFLRKNYFKKTGRTYLQIVHGYRDINGKSKSKVIKSIGYLDELAKEYDDPIAHFTAVAKQMEAERVKNKHLKIDASGEIVRGISNRKNYGHIIFSAMYHELELNRFFKNKQKNEKFEFNSNSIMKILLFYRLLNTQKRIFEIKDLFFDDADFNPEDMCDSLLHFHKISQEAQRFIHERIVEQYGRKTNQIYCTVTNYYFEIDNKNRVSSKKCSDGHRLSPIVQMVLVMDEYGVPITYRLFEGNRSDSQTLFAILQDIKKEYGAKRIIMIADRGLSRNNNIMFNPLYKDGHIYSQNIIGASEAFKSYVLKDEGYTWKEDAYKKKSRIISREVIVTDSNNVKKKIQINQKQIIFYSTKHGEYTKNQREKMIEKAVDLIANPSKYKKNTSHGGAEYVANLKFDKNTGEIIDTAKNRHLDIVKIREEEKFDGYYMIITGEIDKADEEIIKTYQSLWQIEESFKIIKSIFEAKPIHLCGRDYINGHFLICFIAFTIAKLVEIKLKGKYTIEEIIRSLREVTCSHIDGNHYLFDYADKITDDLEEIFKVGFGKKVITFGEIKKQFMSVKKGLNK